MPEDLIVTIEDTSFTFATSDLSNPAIVERLEDVGDIDVSGGKVDGSVLVYKTTTNKWTATTVLDAQDVTGGQY
jgi:myosin-crossreactive antigen